MLLRVVRITVQSRAFQVVEAQKMFNVIIIIIIIFSDPNAVKAELIIKRSPLSHLLKKTPYILLSTVA